MFSILRRIQTIKYTNRYDNNSVFINVSKNASLKTFDYVPDEHQEEGDIKDISRLPSHLRNRMKHSLNLTKDVKETPQPSVLHKREYDRKLFAYFGNVSNINPEIMWPSEEELKNLVEDEREWESDLQVMVDNIKKQKEDEKAERLEREKIVEAQMEKMPELIEKYRQKLYAAHEKEKQQEQARLELLEEAREFYGYKLKEKDPRFAQFVEMKREEEKLTKKSLRKDKKKQIQIEQLKMQS